jgi:hypothetical protein
LYEKKETAAGGWLQRPAVAILLMRVEYTGFFLLLLLCLFLVFCLVDRSMLINNVTSPNVLRIFASTLDQLYTPRSTRCECACVLACKKRGNKNLVDCLLNSILLEVGMHVQLN